MLEEFLKALVGWASERSDIFAVGLAGSHARSAARPDSDVDVVIVATDPGAFFSNAGWMERFGVVSAFQDEDWGRLRSRRVHYATGIEVEFGFTAADWARIDPVDPGTRKVVAGGFRCLYDAEGILRRLVATVHACRVKSVKNS